MIRVCAQFVGIVGMILSAIYLHNKKMKNILIFKMTMDCVWAIHYIMLGALTGFFINVISLFREIIFLRNNEKPKRLHLICFTGINCITAMLTWNGIHSILPAIGCILATYSLWQKKPDITRKIALVNNVLFFIYDGCIGSVSGMMSETFTFISVLIALKRNKEDKKCLV